MKRILCIRLDDWPIERFRAERPELRGKPIVLDELHRGSRRVTACSAEAKALGVTLGMPSAEAVALAGSAPLAVEAHDPSGDREALEALAERCGRFSPLVGLDDSANPDSLLLDVTGLAHLFGGERLLANRVVGDLAQRGLTVRAALADTLGAAWAVSHFGERESARGEGELQSENCKLQIDNCKLKIGGCARRGSPDPAAAFDLEPTQDTAPLAPLAGRVVGGAGFSDKQRPTADWLETGGLRPSEWLGQETGHGTGSLFNGQFAICNGQFAIPLVLRVPPGETSAALRPLPLEALRLPGDVVGLLHQLGVYQIGQLELLPREDLTSRFGPRLIERWDQATGRLAEPVLAHAPPPELCAGQSLEPPTARRETLEYVLEQLIGRLSRMLIRCGRGAVRVDCRLKCPPARSVELRGDCPNFRAAKMGLSPSQNVECQSFHGVEFSVGLFEPTASPRHLFELVRMQFERLCLPAPVSDLSVEATATAPFERRQEELFAGGRRPRSPRQMAGLVDRLAGRLGRKSVSRARLVRDAQPEWAYRYDPLVAGSPSGRSRGGPGGTGGLGGTGILPVQSRRRGREGQAVRYSTGKMPVPPDHNTGKMPVPPDHNTGKMPVAPWQKRPQADLPPRPLRLVGRPIRLTVVSLMPDGPPLRFHLQGREHRIAHTWGPERIETGWWRGRPVRRDYYRVETTTGRRYWLFRDLGDGGWFLHGTFE